MDLKKPPGIIAAMDLPLAEAGKLASRLNKVKDKIAAFKIGSLQTLDVGLRAAVAELRTFSDIPIIYDHQKGSTDIPAIVEKQVRLAADCGVDSFIAVPLGAGLKTLESFVNASKEAGIAPIVLLEMTHDGANDFLKEDTPKKVFDKAVELGVQYLVAPGNKYDMLEKYRGWIKGSGKEMFITSPGIGAQGGEVSKAVQAGTDYPIVGRAIYQAEDPVVVVNELYRGCGEGFSKR